MKGGHKLRWKASNSNEITGQYLWCVLISRDPFPSSGGLPGFGKPNCACLCKSLGRQRSPNPQIEAHIILGQRRFLA